MTNEVEDFDSWMNQLRRLAPNFGFYWNEIEPEDWHDFYKDGLSPHDALIADLDSRITPMINKQSCRTCQFLDVPLNAAGKRIPYKQKVYRCSYPAPQVPLPDSITRRSVYQMPRYYMGPEDGAECPVYQPLIASHDREAEKRGYCRGITEETAERDREWREWLDGLNKAGWMLAARNHKIVPLSWLDDNLPPPDRTPPS